MILLKKLFFSFLSFAFFGIVLYFVLGFLQSNLSLYLFFEKADIEAEVIQSEAGEQELIVSTQLEKPLPFIGENIFYVDFMNVLTSRSNLIFTLEKPDHDLYLPFSTNQKTTSLSISTEQWQNVTRAFNEKATKKSLDTISDWDLKTTYDYYFVVKNIEEKREFLPDMR